MKKKKARVPVVTQINGNVQILSSPMAREQPLPEIQGPVTVTFKHEDEYHGMAIGPMVVTSVDAYDAWTKIHGTPYVNGRGETRYLIPFGSTPEGSHDLGWNTKTVAREIAAHYGVALKEF